MTKSVWIPLLCVVLMSLIGWGAWTTTKVSAATPRIVHDADVKELREDIKEQQTQIITSLEKIWERLK